MKGFIYIIRSYKTDDVYYGSTKTNLSQRMAEHRRCYKKWLNGKFAYVTSFDIIQYDDAYIELVEEIEYNNKQELNAKEGFHIRNNKCVNKCVPDRTYKQWYEDNKETVLIKVKEWNENHIEERKEYLKEYYKNNKERYLKKEQ